MKKKFLLVALLGLVVAVIAGCGGKSISSRAVDCINSMSKGDFASVTKDFDANMKSKLTEDQLKAVWTGITSQTGAFKGTGEPAVTKEDNLDVVTVPCNFEKVSVHVKFVFNSSKEISGLWVNP